MLNLSWKENRVVLSFMSEPTTQWIWRPGIYLTNSYSTILDARKSCKVLIPQTILRSDIGIAALTYYHFCNLLERLIIDIVKNRNIGSKHLRGKELHLNPHGTAKLALNLKATIRKLWSMFGNLGNHGYQSNVIYVSSDHNNF